MNYDNEFISEFNSHYPFERYIVKKPQSIGCRFDDVALVEIFIPSTEIVVKETDRGDWFWTEVDENEIYVKLKGKAGEMRLGYFDFKEHIREEMRGVIYEDFGKYEWQSLYIEYEEEDAYDELLQQLNIQYNLIKEKYGVCNIKASCLNSYVIKGGKVIRFKK